MIIYDFEVFKYDWLMVWLDTDTRKTYSIVNDRELLTRFYEHYKYKLWVGYNSRNYDQYIAKCILAGLDPYALSQWIIVEDKKGFEFSRLLNKFPILNYDTSVIFKSLKEIEAYMGHSIVETSVPFDIDRKLTNAELKEVLDYCETDVMETFQVFIESKSEYESHMQLIKEFKMSIRDVNKTKAQLSASILGASSKPRNDEFELRLPDTIQLGKYEWIKDWYMNWAKETKDYKIVLETELAGVPHKFGWGGLHGSINKYHGEGVYLMADVKSYYPALMIEYDYLSRNVNNPTKYTEIRDERIYLKSIGDPTEYPRKIVLNSTFGASKDPYNPLFDPLQANNICVAGQLLLTDLIDKLEGKCQLIQSNTDGILVKLYDPNDWDELVGICKKWSIRTRMELSYDKYVKVFQKDVNNYIIVDENGKVKRIGGYVKKLSVLDNNLPIVNRAVVEYFVNNTPVEHTVNASNKMIDFQMITKISKKYDYGFKERFDSKHSHTISGITIDKNGSPHKFTTTYKGTFTNERVIRCFASKDKLDGKIYKKHLKKNSFDKTAGTPEHTFTYNGNIEDMKLSPKVDKQWYIDLAKSRIIDFIGE